MSFIGAGGGGQAVAGSLAGSQPEQPKLEATPPPVLAPQGKKPGAKRSQPTFLGADATPGPASGNMGGKTLLGS